MADLKKYKIRNVGGRQVTLNLKEERVNLSVGEEYILSQEEFERVKYLIERGYLVIVKEKQSVKNTAENTKSKKTEEPVEENKKENKETGGDK